MTISQNTPTIASTPFVGAMIVHGGKILLGKRSLHRPTYPGIWDLIGGHVEMFETLEVAIAREVREEVGIILEEVHLIGNFRFDKPPVGLIDYGVFVAIHWRGQPTIMNDEHSELRWFTLKEALALTDMSLSQNPQLFQIAVEFGQSA